MMTTAVRPLLISLLTFSLILPCLSIGDDIHLIAFKESLKESSSLDSTWIKDSDPCDRKKPWRGVDCSDTGFKTVSSLLLMNLGLSGYSEDIDIDALGNLHSLRILSLENNTFSGPMPEFSKLTSLKSLFLSSNLFFSEIPKDFFNKMGSLQKLQLAANKFSGRIPDSLTRLANLVEMQLQQNEFSGAIPPFEQDSLQVVDLSYNKLEGEVPTKMYRFQAKAFEGNAGVCGSLVSKVCAVNQNAYAPSGPIGQEPTSATKWMILGLVVSVLLVMVLLKSDKKNEDFRVLGKENIDEVVTSQVHSGSINKRSVSSSRRGSSYSGNDSVGSCSSRREGRTTNDLVLINEEKGVFGLPDLMKAAAEVLGSGGLGSAYKAAMANGVTVVVKRMRDLNKLNRDGFDIEIRRLGRIRHRNILPPLAYHYRKEEKLLINEYINKGSLLSLLHGDRGIAHAELDWSTRLKIIKGVSRGMGFLHTEFANYEVPHGNLKSSNILLSPNYEPLLTDYALYSLTSNAQALFAHKCPEAILYQQLSQKSDVYCLGIVILEIMTGKLPSQYLNNQKGGTDVVQWIRQAISEGRVAELIDPEISNTSASLEQMVKMLRIGATCTESDAEMRIEMREAIRSIEEVQV